MDATGPTLLRRALAVLQAKQYLVFYAIPVYALAAVVPLVLSWLHDGGSANDAIGRVQAPLYDAVAAPGLLSVGLVVLYLAAFTWFRAGYIRSIVGRFHARPQNGGQFASLLGLYTLDRDRQRPRRLGHRRHGRLRGHHAGRHRRLRSSP